MLNKGKFKKDNTVECPVCGKTFTRGLLDLTRHVNAVTLQHLYFEGSHEAFPNQCSRCNISFKSDVHLAQHRAQTTCTREKPFKLKKKVENEEVEESNIDDLETSPRGQVSLAASSVEDSAAQQLEGNDDGEDVSDPNAALEGKTLECMVCGKLFPRGPIDLQRHATAITLKHLVSDKKAPGFHHGCNTCGLHFGTAEHLAMHKSQSTCNEYMVWPRDAHVTSGLRVIPRSEYNNTVANSASKSSPKSVKTRPKRVERTRNMSSSSLQSSAALSDEANNAVSSSSRAQGISSVAAENKKRHQEAVQLELSAARQKRVRIIVPEERQAFFGVVSLLINPAQVDPAIKITDDNYMNFIPAEHLPLIERLQNALLYG